MSRLVQSRAFATDVERILRASEEEWGREGRLRYTRLVRQALADLAHELRRLGVRSVPERPDLYGHHLRHGRNTVPVGQRVGQPRHVVYFRLDGQGTVRLLRLLHDRMLPDRWLPASGDGS